MLDCSREQRLQAASVVVEPVLKPLSIQLKRLSADEFCSAKRHSASADKANISDDSMEHDGEVCCKVSAREDHPQSGPHDKAPPETAAAVTGRVDAGVRLKSKKSKCKTKQLSSGPATAVNGVLSSEDQSSLLVKSLPSLKSTVSPSTNMASGVIKTTVEQDGEEQITSVMPVSCTMAPSTHAAADFNGSSIANIGSLQTEPDEMFVFMDEGPRGSDDPEQVEVQNQKSRGRAGRRRCFPRHGTSRGGSSSLSTNSALDTAGNCAVSERGCGRGRQGGSRSRRFGSRRGRGVGRGSTDLVHHDVLEATGRDSAMNWSTSLYAMPGCDMLLDSFAGDIGSL